MANDLAKLMSLEDPYVHSNLENMVSAEADFRRSPIGRASLDSRIDNLKKISEQLRQKAEQFASPINLNLPPNKLYEELLLDNDVYRIALKNALNSNKVYNAIKSHYIINIEQSNVKNIVNTLRNSELQSEVLKTISTNSIRVEDLAAVSTEYVRGSVYNAFKNSFDKENLKYRKTRITTEAFIDRAAAVGVDLNNKATKKILDRATSTNKSLTLPQVKKLIEDNIKKNTANTQSMESFRQSFLYAIEKEYMYYLSQSGNYDERLASQYFQQFAADARKTWLNESTPLMRAAITGKMGEEAITSIISNVGQDSVVTAINVGSELHSNLINKGIMESLNEAELYLPHRLDTQSWIDIQVTRNGVKANIQAKNYQSIAQQWLRSSDENWKEYFGPKGPSSLVTDYLAAAHDMGKLSTQEVAQIAYNLANYAWFYTHDGYGHNENLGHQSMSNDVLIRSMGELVVQTLGVVFDKSFKVMPDSSTLFYLINNTLLIPTYQIVDAIVTQMEGGANELYGAHVSVDFSKVRYLYTPAKFYEAKKDALSRLNLRNSGIYRYPEELAAIGREQGASIMKDLKMSKMRGTVELGRVLDKSQFKNLVSGSIGR